jgi:hypothetical protein
MPRTAILSALTALAASWLAGEVSAQPLNILTACGDELQQYCLDAATVRAG